MASTLAKYVDLENVPKKYGGTLDWNFGDMPNLEPAIVNSMQWREKFEDKGHRTFPIGPIKWTYDESGELLATAVGSENGKPREKVIAGLHPQAGVARLALNPGRVDKAYPVPGATPKDPAPALLPVSITSNSTSISTPTPIPNGNINMSSDANLNVGKDPGSHVSESSIRGTYTVPYKEDTNTTTSDERIGTSETRYIQQGGTHAEGQLAHATPETKADSQGEQQALMDPHTVGQAPKEHPLPIPEEPQPGVIDQAKDMAGQAVEQARQLPTTVMNAVGMGEKKEEIPQEEAKKEDPEIDAMSGKNVEEYLRSKTMSKPGG